MTKTTILWTRSKLRSLVQTPPVETRSDGVIIWRGSEWELAFHHLHKTGEGHPNTVWKAAQEDWQKLPKFHRGEKSKPWVYKQEHCQFGAALKVLVARGLATQMKDVPFYTPIALDQLSEKFMSGDPLPVDSHNNNTLLRIPSTQLETQVADQGTEENNNTLIWMGPEWKLAYVILQECQEGTPKDLWGRYMESWKTLAKFHTTSSRGTKTFQESQERSQFGAALRRCSKKGLFDYDPDSHLYTLKA